MDPAVLDALPRFAPDAAVIAEFSVRESWGTGYWGEVTVTAPGPDGADDWSLTLFLPDGWTIDKSWGVTITPTPAPTDRSRGTPDPGAIPTLMLDGGPVAYRVEPDGTIAADLPPAGTATWGMVVNENHGPGLTVVRNPALLAPASDPPAADPRTRPRYLGFNIASWWQGTFGTAAAFQALDALADTGADTVAVVPTRYVEGLTGSRIITNIQTETDAAVAAMIRHARRLGLTVMIKPHINLVDFGPHRQLDPADPDAFFADFTEVMVHYATLGAENGATLMSLGGELAALTRPENRDRWLRVIEAVRAVFPGRLTYAADGAEVLQVPFWDRLDYIGIDLYTPLARTGSPTLAGAVAALIEPPTIDSVQADWDGLPVLEALRRVSRNTGTPVILTEIGYRSADRAGVNPTHFDETDTPDPAEQALLYDAVFTALSEARADWLAGVILWDWDATPARPGAPPPSPVGFSPAGKPAAAVARAWFDRLRAPPQDRQ